MELAGVNKKRLIIRSILLALLIALGFVLFYIGKEHEILLDNKSVEIGGKSYGAIKYLKVTVDGDEAKEIELYADDRDITKVKGPSHKVRIQIINEDTEEVIKTVERSFNLGKTPTVMISIPALAEGAPDVYLQLPNQFNAAQEEAVEQEKEKTREEIKEDLKEEKGTMEAPVLSD